VITAKDRVVEVVKDRPTIDKLAGSTQVIQAGADVGVFSKAPPLVLLVPAVDGQEVVPPHRHVASDDSALGCVTSDDGKWESKRFGGTGELTREQETKSWNGFANFE